MYISLIHAQTILCGMGELHIEIIHDRIKREYNIETHLGPLQVAYRETILQSATATGEASANSPLVFYMIVYFCENHITLFVMKHQNYFPTTGHLFCLSALLFYGPVRLMVTIDFVHG